MRKHSSKNIIIKIAVKKNIKRTLHTEIRNCKQIIQGKKEMQNGRTKWSNSKLTNTLGKENNQFIKIKHGILPTMEEEVKIRYPKHLQSVFV